MAIEDAFLHLFIEVFAHFWRKSLNHWTTRVIDVAMVQVMPRFLVVHRICSIIGWLLLGNFIVMPNLIHGLRERQIWEKLRVSICLTLRPFFTDYLVAG